MLSNGMAILLGYGLLLSDLGVASLILSGGAKTLQRSELPTIHQL
jgi:hypothetical protein